MRFLDDILSDYFRISHLKDQLEDTVRNSSPIWNIIVDGAKIRVNKLLGKGRVDEEVLDFCESFVVKEMQYKNADLLEENAKLKEKITELESKKRKFW